MLAVLSPAKSLDMSPAQAAVPVTQPGLMKEAMSLMRTARGLSQKRLRELMGLSPELAKLNHDRFHSFELPFTEKNALAAAFAFDGEVYRGLAARTLTADDLAWAQDHLAILSGLFGVLRPLDLIQPYRLEMGTPWEDPARDEFYAFWGERITKRLNETLAGHPDPTVVNLASGEYWKGVLPRRLRGEVVQCVFEDWKEHEDEGAVISFLAKHARGLMARYLIASRIDRPEGLKDFNLGGYVFRPARSRPDRLVFSRKFTPAQAG